MSSKTSTTNFASINGAQIYYEEAGSGFPLVMLHAGIADLRMWDDQFPFFAQHYRAIRYDLRGYGRSKMVRGRFAHHADLYELLRQLNVESAYLMGCSMGGETIIDFAVEHPEMAAALITVGASPSGFEFEGRPPAEMSALEEALKRGQKDEAAEIAARLWLDGRKRKPGQVDPAVRQKMLEMVKPALGAFGAQQNRQELEPPAAVRLDALSLPLLAIIGDRDDPNIERAADTLVAAVPSGKKVILSDTAHLPNLERPEDFNQIVLGFLKGIDL